MLKSAARAAVLAHRQALSPAMHDQAALRCQKQLLDLLEPYKDIAWYMPKRHELDVYPAMLSSMRRGQRACLPRCEGASLVFVSYKLGDRLCYHPRYKLYEPLGMASMPECIVLPALALMPSGHRLGYGEGFYDRTLEGLNHIIRIGVTHQPKEALAWQPETHDIILDHCLWF